MGDGDAKVTLDALVCPTLLRVRFGLDNFEAIGEIARVTLLLETGDVCFLGFGVPFVSACVCETTCLSPRSTLLLGIGEGTDLVTLGAFIGTDFGSLCTSNGTGFMLAFLCRSTLIGGGDGEDSISIVSDTTGDVSFTGDRNFTTLDFCNATGDLRDFVFLEVLLRVILTGGGKGLSSLMLVLITKGEVIGDRGGLATNTILAGDDGASLLTIRLLCSRGFSTCASLFLALVSRNTRGDTSGDLQDSGFSAFDGVLS